MNAIIEGLITGALILCKGILEAFVQNPWIPIALGIYWLLNKAYKAIHN